MCLCLTGFHECVIKCVIKCVFVFDRIPGVCYKVCYKVCVCIWQGSRSVIKCVIKCVFVFDRVPGVCYKVCYKVCVCVWQGSRSVRDRMSHSFVPCADVTGSQTRGENLTRHCNCNHEVFLCKQLCRTSLFTSPIDIVICHCVFRNT